GDLFLVEVRGKCIERLKLAKVIQLANARVRQRCAQQDDVARSTGEETRRKKEREGEKKAFHGSAAEILPRPGARRRPSGRFRSQLARSLRFAIRLGERRVHEKRLCKLRVGIGVVVAKTGLQQFDVIAVNAQGIFAIAALQLNVRKRERLKLLNLRMERDR